MLRRNLLATAPLLAVNAAAGTANTKPKLVLTGDRGNVAGRLGWLAEKWDVVGIDKKRGEADDLFYRSSFLPSAWTWRLRDAAVVIHCAGHLGDEMDAVMRDNLNATANLLQTVRTVSPHAHIVFASSVWAAPGTWGHRGSVDGPEGWYGWSKRAIEEMIQVHVAETGGSASIIQLGSVPPKDQPMPERLAALDANGWPANVLMSEPEIEQAFRLALERPRTTPGVPRVRLIDLRTLRMGAGGQR